LPNLVTLLATAVLITSSTAFSPLFPTETLWCCCSCLEIRRVVIASARGTEDPGSNPARL
jgi:hypothetical protein